MPLRIFLPRRHSEPPSIAVTHERATYDVRVRRHRQARRYTLRIHAVTREIVLTMPPRGSLRDAQHFAQKHGAWIAARLNRLPGATALADGVEVPLRGIMHRVSHRPGRRGVVWTETKDDGTHLLCVAGEAPHINRRVIDFFKREAAADLGMASRRYAGMLDVTIKRISIRDQTSRWGSCSCTGVLSYSWRLVLAPPFVLDYLAAHEVAHRVELNHSPRFWRTLQRICPDMDRAKAWLDAHGTGLHHYGQTVR
jgi:predicted metal-dependent hydrolase